MEKWAFIDGTNEVFKVSSFGRVMRVRGGKGTYAGRVLKPFFVSKGYPAVDLYYGGEHHVIMVHVLVMRSFVGVCPKGMEINHRDGNPRNTVLKNLEYTTHKKNTRHAYRIGLIRTKLSIADIQEIRRRYKRRDEGGRNSTSGLAIEFGVSRWQIWAVANYRTWVSLEEEE